MNELTTVSSKVTHSEARKIRKRAEARNLTVSKFLRNKALENVSNE